MFTASSEGWPGLISASERRLRECVSRTARSLPTPAYANSLAHITGHMALPPLCCAAVSAARAQQIWLRRGRTSEPLHLPVLSVSMTRQPEFRGGPLIERPAQARTWGLDPDSMSWRFVWPPDGIPAMFGSKAHPGKQPLPLHGFDIFRYPRNRRLWHVGVKLAWDVFGFRIFT